MEVIDPGHGYLLRMLDGDEVIENSELWFVKREGPNYPGNVGSHRGTTTQEVLRALIDRAKYVNNQIFDHHNFVVMYHLRAAILELELRAAERHGRTLPLFDINDIENQPTCSKCNHIGCEGICH